MTSPIVSGPSSDPSSARPLILCHHCEMLGASAAIQADSEMTDVIYCSICRLRFQVSTEGSRVIVLSVEAWPIDLR